jgi:hypothetical protein
MKSLPKRNAQNKKFRQKSRKIRNRILCMGKKKQASSRHEKKKHQTPQPRKNNKKEAKLCHFDWTRSTSNSNDKNISRCGKSIGCYSQKRVVLNDSHQLLSMNPMHFNAQMSSSLSALILKSRVAAPTDVFSFYLILA